MEECRNFTLLEVSQDTLRGKGSLFDRHCVGDLPRRKYTTIRNTTQRLGMGQFLWQIGNVTVAQQDCPETKIRYIGPLDQSIEERTFKPQNVLKNFK